MTNREWLLDLLQEKEQFGRKNTPQTSKDALASAIVRAALEEVGRLPNNVVPFPSKPEQVA